MANSRLAVRKRPGSISVARPSRLIHAGEILDIPFGLEADQVIGGEGVQQAVVGRHGQPHIGRRPRDVQEETDAILGAVGA